MSEEIKAVSYCVGMSIAGSLMQQNLEGISTDILAEAVSDMFQGKEPKYSPEEANAIIQTYLGKITSAQFEQNKTAGETFLAKNFNKEGVTTTLSGLQYEVLEKGDGPKPNAQDTVTVHYTGTLLDGTVFDSSLQRGTPATFGLNQVISGWTEGLQLMPKGSKFRFYIPQELGYGANAPGGLIKPYMALIFDVELIDIA